ncbi:MAG: DUF4434 domain-containing protein, partial [Ignavibacteriaceae bacterium]|nr:DUF4434 domain-containing protein [Ignavibacteriaceae bacterium]
LQTIVESEEGQTNKTIYPSSLANTELAYYVNGKDLLGNCLRNAEAAGIKVFVGTSANSLWWGSHGSDTTWLYNQMEYDNQVCDEVWSLYKNKYPNTFYGWYWAYEVDNGTWASEAAQSELIHAMNLQLDHLSAKGEKLPFMWCPFMNVEYGTADEYKALWVNVFSQLHTTTGDIFSPQDLVGKGGYTLTEMDEWFAALRQAVDTKPGLLLWPDVETFNFDGTSATIDRVVAQMKVEQPYSDNYMTFAFCHYDSPNNIDSGFYKTYIDYLNNGVVESVVPSAPTNLKGTINFDGYVQLNWGASTDNIGICGYYIYRNGQQICREEVPVLNGAASTPLATNITDVASSSNTDYTYEVKAYDFAGNISEAASLKINSGSITYLSNKISTGCSYTVSSPADAGYPDAGNKELTNGSFARINSKGDPAWEGYYNSNKAKRDIIIDLGSEKTVQQCIAYFLYDSSSSILLPTRVNVSISTNNSDFTDAGVLAIPDIATGTTASSCRCINTLLTSANARYVKFSVTPGSEWTFDDEYEVRNGNSTGVNAEPVIPKEYSLSQNYPNPFNPSTVINYQITKKGNVSLKVFNILGKEIAALVNEEKPAGSYSVNFNASSIPSGVYFYQIKSGSYSATKKMILMK